MHGVVDVVSLLELTIPVPDGIVEEFEKKVGETTSEDGDESKVPLRLSLVLVKLKSEGLAVTVVSTILVVVEIITGVELLKLEENIGLAVEDTELEVSEEVGGQP